MDKEKICYFTAKKEIERKTEGEVETVKFHTVDIFNDEIYKIIADIEESIENHDDDYESLYSKGINYSWDDLFSYDIDKFIIAINDQIECQKEDYGATDEDVADWCKVLKFLEDWKGYVFILEEKEL